jgi:hypothetical protein
VWLGFEEIVPDIRHGSLTHDIYNSGQSELCQ